MTTWAQLLADIRVDLKDEGTTPRWSDAAIYLYAKDAIRDYSTVFPLRVTRVPLAESGGSYQLPTNFVSVVDIECPQDRFLEERLTRPGVKYSNSGSPKHYTVYGGSVYLDASPGTDPVLLTYDARHVIPTGPADATTIMSVPELDEELIRLYVKAKATEQIRTQQSSLDRFKPGNGSRDDNPMTPENRDLMRDYRYKIAERITGGAIMLFRPGRAR